MIRSSVLPTEPSAELRMSWNESATSSPTSAPTRKIALLLPLVIAVSPLNAVAMVAPVTLPAFAS